MRKVLRGLLLVATVAAISAIAFLSYRNKAMERLYAEAMGYPPFWRSSRESQAAAKKLATYRGRRSTDMLLDLALQDNPLALEVQAEAIKALGERNDPRIAPALANLLQPHEGLDTRQAAAGALQRLSCKGECVRSILYYLERVWRGEPNYEDRIVRPVGFDEVRISLQKDQQAVYSALHSVLQREKNETVGALIKDHGIGTSTPSVFALELASRVQLREACPLLLESDRNIRQFFPEFDKAPRQELQAAIASLSCK